jgi:hypothetical protein
MTTPPITNQVELLERHLIQEFVPHLPPLMNQDEPESQQAQKNLSRAFGAFVIQQIAGIGARDAAQAVTDDYEDNGIDVFYYNESEETLYLLQSKFKPGRQFTQKEALEFCDGVRKISRQDLDGFNQNFQLRINEIQDAVDCCCNIEIVVAHVGTISQHAASVINNFLTDNTHGEERFNPTFKEYGPDLVIAALQLKNSYEDIKASLLLRSNSSVGFPRQTYFGLVSLKNLSELHQTYGEALYAKNVRSFLGKNTNVNLAIRQTLENKPEDFLFFNNGVTIIGKEIHPKGNRTIDSVSWKRFEIEGMSIINGAQTVASAARYMEENDGIDISKALVSVTIIRSGNDTDFERAITFARNHQNQISLGNFLALDSQQERLRRELVYLNITYSYKEGVQEAANSSLHITSEEAAQALALFQPDPRFAIWLKQDPRIVLDMSSEQYSKIFCNELSAQKLTNAVRFKRYLDGRVQSIEDSSQRPEKLAYKHGKYVLGWILAKRLADEVDGPKLFDITKLNNKLSIPFDELRQLHWEKIQNYIDFGPNTEGPGPLAFFKRQVDVLSLIEELVVEDFSLAEDPILVHRRSEQNVSQPYPKNLFDYLISKAPQITGLHED